MRKERNESPRECKEWEVDKLTLEEAHHFDQKVEQYEDDLCLQRSRWVRQIVSLVNVQSDVDDQIQHREPIVEIDEDLNKQ